jgi:hypothetical protein
MTKGQRVGGRVKLKEQDKRARNQGARKSWGIKGGKQHSYNAEKPESQMRQRGRQFHTNTKRL